MCTYFAIFARLSSLYRGAHTKIVLFISIVYLRVLRTRAVVFFVVLLNSVPVTRSTTVQFKSCHVCVCVCVLFSVVLLAYYSTDFKMIIVIIMNRITQNMSKSMRHVLGARNKKFGRNNQLVN